MSSLWRIPQDLLTRADVREGILCALRTTVQVCDATLGYVMLLDATDPTFLRTEVGHAVRKTASFPARVAIGQGISGLAAQAAETVWISHAEGRKPDFDGIDGVIGSGVSMPLRSPGNGSSVVGVLTLLSDSQKRPLTYDCLEAVRCFADQIALALAAHDETPADAGTALSILESVAVALESRDHRFVGHTRRVAALCDRISQRMGLSTELRRDMRAGIVLRNLGYLDVPDSILTKDGALSLVEMEILREHPLRSVELCDTLHLPEAATLVIRHHHERLDGTGYPDGLTAEKTPAHVRLVCAADAFDAAVVRRGIREPGAFHFVLGQMKQLVGVRFDTAAVEGLDALSMDRLLLDLYAGQEGI